MANPTWVTQLPGTTTNVVMIDNSTYIEWDTLTITDQARLIELVDAYGGAIPLAQPVAGYQTIHFTSAINAGTPTGFGNVAAATSGAITVDLNGTAVSGDACGLLNIPSRVYANVIIDNTITKTIIVEPNSVTTFAELLNAINAALSGHAVASIVGGNIVITSDAVGPTSTVSILDTGLLFKTVVGYVGITSPAIGEAKSVYSFTVQTSQSTDVVTFDGVDAQTFGDLVTYIDSNYSFTIEIVGGYIKITDPFNGYGSYVDISGSAFVGLPTFLNIGNPVFGADTFADGYNQYRFNNGVIAKDYFITRPVGFIAGAIVENEISNDSGNPIKTELSAAQYGTAGTGITQPTGGSGLSGFISGIYNRLVRGQSTSANSLSVTQASDGVFSVAGTANVGNAPINPPLAVSGVDAGGLKRHLLTQTTGAVTVTAEPRTCLGRATFSVTTGAVVTLGTTVPTSGVTAIPAGAVCALIQADGSTISITLDGSTTPTATIGTRIDDGVIFGVDSVLSSVKFIARIATTNVHVSYFNRA